MTPRQKRILLVLSVAIALSRPLAVAHSLNDWDEALFSLGVVEYDINQHHPHPPGYPLFVMAAKGVALFGLEAFRALQIVVLMGGFFLFPVLFFFAKELGFGFSTSAVAAAIFMFLPNVWVYGGTGFSDVPSIALGLLACTLLLRGRTDRSAYILGAVVLGVAAGFRLPNLLLGAVPSLLATGARLRLRDFRAVALAMVLGGAIVGGSYLGAALASGTLAQYSSAVGSQAKYVRAVDSWHNPDRAPLSEVAEKFFLWPFTQRVQMKALFALAVFGVVAVIVQRRWRLLVPLAIFGPLMVVAWLNLDVEAAGRYAIAYLPLYTLFVAHALYLIARREVIHAVLGAAVAIVLASWTWPALRLQRGTDAPPAAALLWVKRNVPATATVYVQGALKHHAAYLMSKHQTVIYQETQEIVRDSHDVWVVEPQSIEGAMNFVWPRTELWEILRRRNFEAAALRLESFVEFGDGWYQQEGSGTDMFRWMGREAHAELPEVEKGRLSLQMYVPVDSIQPPPAIEVWVNDALLERFVSAEAVVNRTWVLPSRKGARNHLRIVTSAVAVPARVSGSEDTRELGLRMDELSWTSVP